MGTTRAVNTMGEVLQNMMGEISRAKLMPDADLQFLIGLETSILDYTHQQSQSPMQQMGQPGMQPGGPPGMPPGGGMMPSPGEARMGGVPQQGPTMAGQPPNMDEIARMLR